MQFIHIGNQLDSQIKIIFKEDKERIPIFIVVKDRLTALKKSFDSYNEQINYPVEYVFIDNNSTYKPTIEYLKQKESSGHKVYWNKCKTCNTSSFPAAWPKIIKEHIHNIKSGIPNYYVLTDSDIELDNVCKNILEIFIYIINKINTDCVGPALRIDDIPDYYPLKSDVLKKHKEFWMASKIKKINLNGNVIKYINAPIATTFGLYRSKYTFKRWKHAIRVFEPYSAKHLDWYINPDCMTDDQKYYLNNKVTHWSGIELRKCI